MTASAVVDVVVSAMAHVPSLGPDRQGAVQNDGMKTLAFQLAQIEAVRSAPGL